MKVAIKKRKEKNLSPFPLWAEPCGTVVPTVLF
jgi:hypothetical protein